MPILQETLTLDDAELVLRMATGKADELGVASSIAIVDVGGHLIAFRRQHGAMIGTIELAINKAFSARIFDNGTEALAVFAQPGAELYGIQHSHGGRGVIFGGGLPIRSNGKIIGAVGVSGGTVAQDMAIAGAAASAI